MQCGSRDKRHPRTSFGVSLCATALIGGLTCHSGDEADVQEQHAPASTSHTLDMSNGCHTRMVDPHPATSIQHVISLGDNNSVNYAN